MARTLLVRLAGELPIDIDMGDLLDVVQDILSTDAVDIVGMKTANERAAVFVLHCYSALFHASIGCSIVDFPLALLSTVGFK